VPDYAPGTQKNVSGEVIRWNNVSGPERIDAKKYIELLEAEIEELNHQVGRKSNGQNELLEYLKSLEPQNLKVRKTAALYYVILLFKCVTFTWLQHFAGFDKQCWRGCCACNEYIYKAPFGCLRSQPNEGLPFYIELHGYSLPVCLILYFHLAPTLALCLIVFTARFKFQLIPLVSNKFS
jgi:hypothetical protein